MRLQNFGSYKSLDFDFQNQGLTLIQGPTGSGKSTLMDAIPWILYGRTAKNGTADEIRAWNSPGVTHGAIRLDSGVVVYRSRLPNDLYFYSDSSGSVDSNSVDISLRTRGKDLKDTQKLIDELLGIDYETYLSGAYFHEFSQTAQFFNTTAKNRRQICEQIVDLSLPKTLQEKLILRKKDLKNQLDTVGRQISTYETEIRQLQQLQISEGTKAKKWEESWLRTIDMVATQHQIFEKNRTRIITNECRTCGTVLEKPHKHTDTSENPYADRLAALKNDRNPHEGNIKDFTSDIGSKTEERAHAQQYERMLESDLQDLETLESATEAFRSTLISNTVSYIEDITNDLLTRHFDAEIRVAFAATDADKLRGLYPKGWQ